MPQQFIQHLLQAALAVSQSAHAIAGSFAAVAFFALLAVLSLAVISHTAFNASRMTVSLAAIQLKAPTYMVGLLLSLYALLPMLLSLPFGRWIDRVGTRLPMLLGAIGLAVGFSVPAF